MLRCQNCDFGQEWWLQTFMDEPPNIPIFNGSLTKKPKRQESFSEALTSTACALAQALTHSSAADKQQDIPEKATDQRRKNLEQLQFIKHLRDDNILIEIEYNEQKQKILDIIRSL